jgi:hypothetical protein
MAGLLIGVIGIGFVLVGVTVFAIAKVMKMRGIGCDVNF